MYHQCVAKFYVGSEVVCIANVGSEVVCFTRVGSEKKSPREHVYMVTYACVHVIETSIFSF